METKPTYKIGDKVRIINYGHPIWESKSFYKESTSKHIIYEDEELRWIDISPNIVGKEGIVEKVDVVQGTPQYSIKGIGAWYFEEQMEMAR